MAESIEQSVEKVAELLPAAGSEMSYRDFHAAAVAATANYREALKALRQQGRMKTRLEYTEDGEINHLVFQPEGQ